jgi:hypothetical protein
LLWFYRRPTIVSELHADSPAALVARVAEVLRSHRIVDFAFTGGLAVGVWSTPRQTRDLDVCGALPLEEVDRLIATRGGLRSGPGELPDMVRFRVGDWDVDLFVSKWPYDRECLERAVRVQIEGVDARVVTAEDLLIHKMIKLRTDRRRLLQDLADIRWVLQAQAARIDWNYVQKWLPADESSFLAMASSASDEDLVRRLLGT